MNKPTSLNIRKYIEVLSNPNSQKNKDEILELKLRAFEELEYLENSIKETNTATEEVLNDISEYITTENGWSIEEYVADNINIIDKNDLKETLEKYTKQLFLDVNEIVKTFKIF